MMQVGTLLICTIIFWHMLPEIDLYSADLAPSPATAGEELQ